MGRRLVYIQPRTATKVLLLLNVFLCGQKLRLQAFGSLWNYMWPSRRSIKCLTLRKSLSYSRSITLFSFCWGERPWKESQRPSVMTFLLLENTTDCGVRGVCSKESLFAGSKCVKSVDEVWDFFAFLKASLVDGNHDFFYLVFVFRKVRSWRSYAPFSMNLLK